MYISSQTRSQRVWSGLHSHIHSEVYYYFTYLFGYVSYNNCVVNWYIILVHTRQAPAGNVSRLLNQMIISTDYYAMFERINYMQINLHSYIRWNVSRDSFNWFDKKIHHRGLSILNIRKHGKPRDWTETKLRLLSPTTTSISRYRPLHVAFNTQYFYY